jgi:hypothetical protein
MEECGGGGGVSAVGRDVARRKLENRNLIRAIVVVGTDVTSWLPNRFVLPARHLGRLSDGMGHLLR